jgi:type IV pilus assembly protein PilV
MNTSSLPRRSTQHGSFMLEALIAILIISFGILGMVGLQAQSMRQVNDAQFRAEAAYYASSVAAQMWAYDPTSVETYFSSSGAGFMNFASQVTASVSGLPGAAANPPTITFNDAAIVNSNKGRVATISINWQYPGETTVHNYSTQAVFGMNEF